MYPSNRVGTANPVSVRVRVMVSASLSSVAVESPVLIESRQWRSDRRPTPLYIGLFYTSNTRRA